MQPASGSKNPFHSSLSSAYNEPLASAAQAAADLPLQDNLDQRPLLVASSSLPVASAASLTPASAPVNKGWFGWMNPVWENTKSICSTVATGATDFILGFSPEDDRKYLKNLTGSDEIFTLVDTLLPFLPGPIPDCGYRPVIQHMLVSAIKSKNLPSDQKISTGTLVLESIKYYEDLFKTSFLNAEIAAAKDKISYPELRHFTVEAVKISQIALPNIGGWFSGYLAQFLFETYDAQNTSILTPDTLGFNKDLEEGMSKAFRHFVPLLFNNEVLKDHVDQLAPPSISGPTKQELIAFAISRKDEVMGYEGPLVNFAVRKLAEVLKWHPAASLSEFLTNASNYIGRGDNAKKQKLIQFFLGNLADEKRIPKGLREGVNEFIAGTLIPSYGSKILQFLKIISTEGDYDVKAPLENWPIRAGLDSAVNQLADDYYGKLNDLIPKPWDSMVSEKLGKALLKQVLMHVMRNYSKGVEVVPSSESAFISEIINFVIYEVNKAFKEAKEHPLKAEKSFLTASETIFSRLIPSAISPPLNFHVKGGEILFKLWKLHESFEGERIAEGLKDSCPGYDEQLIGFLRTVDAKIDDIVVENGEKFKNEYLLTKDLKLKIKGVETPFEFLGQVTKVILFSWSENILRATPIKAGQNPLEAIFLHKTSLLKTYLPYGLNQEKSKAWLNFSKTLFAEIPEQIPGRQWILESLTPALLVRSREFTSLVIQEESVDREVLEHPIYRGSESVVINKAVEQIVARLFPNKERYPEVFTRPLVKAILEHFMDRSCMGAKRLPNIYTPFINLFKAGVLGYEANQSQGLIDEFLGFIHPAFTFFGKDQGKLIAPYLAAMEPSDTARIKSEISRVLTGSKLEGVDVQRLIVSDELAGSLELERSFKPHMDLISDLISGVSSWIVDLGVEYLQSNDSSLPYLKKVFDQQEFLPIKGFLAAKVNEILLFAVKNIGIKMKQRDPAVPNDQIMQTVVNDLIMLLKDHAPSRSSARNKEAWLPFVNQTLTYFFTDIKDVLPVPEKEKDQVVLQLKNFLAELAVKWHGRIYTYMDVTQVSKDSLKKELKTNHASVFASVVGRRWVQEFIPHIIKEERDSLATLAKDWVQKKLHVVLPKDVEALIAKTLESFSDDYGTVSGRGEKSPVYEVSKWSGEFAEAYILKILSEISKRINKIESDRPLILAFLEKVMPMVLRYYKAIEVLKEKHQNTRAGKIDRKELLKELHQPSDRGPTLLNRGLPLASDETEQAMDDRRREHFQILANELLTVLGLDKVYAPFPEPFQDVLHDLVTGLILGNTFLAIEKAILENRGAFLLDAYSAIKTASQKLIVQAAPATIQRKRNIDPLLKKNLGDILSRLIGSLPNHPWAPIMEIRQLKSATGEQLVDLIADEDIIVRMNEMFAAIIPKLVPGRVVEMDSGDIKFEQNTAEPISFSTAPKNEKQFIRQIKKEGAEAFMSGLESLGKDRFRQEKARIEGYAKQGFKIIGRLFREEKEPGTERTKKEQILEDLFEWVKHVCDKGYTFLVDVVLIPLLIGILYIPYHLLVRWPLTWYFSYLANSIYDEVTAAYHEGLILNIMEEMFESITRDRSGDKKV